MHIRNTGYNDRFKLTVLSKFCDHVCTGKLDIIITPQELKVKPRNGIPDCSMKFSLTN